MIYLDNAATTMKKPQCVIDAVISAMSNMGNAGRGANEASLDASRINGKYLINLDSEDEGIILSSCAGGLRSDCNMPIDREEKKVRKKLHYKMKSKAGLMTNFFILYVCVPIFSA